MALTKSLLEVTHIHLVAIWARPGAFSVSQTTVPLTLISTHGKLRVTFDYPFLSAWKRPDTETTSETSHLLAAVRKHINPVTLPDALDKIAGVNFRQMRNAVKRISQAMRDGKECNQENIVFHKHTLHRMSFSLCLSFRHRPMSLRTYLQMS
jgi:hypothetical protein